MEHCSLSGTTWLNPSRVEALRARLRELQTLLEGQIQSLPFGHEHWLDTERELNAAEATLASLGDWSLI
jgi:hypothetical protein